MTEFTIPMDEELADNITLSAQVSNVLVLAGKRQFDRFLVSDQGGVCRTRTLERLCHENLEALATWVYDPSGEGCLTLSQSQSELNLNTSLPTRAGKKANGPLEDICKEFSKLEAPMGEKKYVLVVNASLLMEDPAGPRGADISLVRAIDRFSRRADRSHVMVLRVGKTADLPFALTTSTYVKVVHIPAASRDVRHAYCHSRGERLAKLCHAEVDDVATTGSNLTEDWTLSQVDALFHTAEKQEISRLNDFEELARAVFIGNTNSPWSGDRLRMAVANAESQLTARVMGQPVAIGSVVSYLRKAVVGLSTAHQSSGSQAPRAVMFFSGPTGTGKTELAKAISQLIFGQEQVLRFDCGELRQEHAVARLIGAPPGYVGYDQGGELTEGIRSKPNSVVLFDEIEKAHPRLLDTLMSMLDDGRLTSGQGETALFGQSIVIFTSNLGMYEVASDEEGRVVRRPRFDYDTPFETIQGEVRDAVRHEFVTELGRPELLGRFGGAKSIVVFDFLRDIDNVCRKFVTNIAANCERLNGIELVVDESVIQRVADATKSRPDALVLGGRGLKPELDRLLTDPLADYLFEHQANPSSLHVTIEGEETRFTPRGCALPAPVE